MDFTCQPQLRCLDLTPSNFPRISPEIQAYMRTLCIKVLVYTKCNRILLYITWYIVSADNYFFQKSRDDESTDEDNDDEDE